MVDSIGGPFEAWGCDIQRFLVKFTNGEKKLVTNGQTDRRTDRRKADGRTDGRTYRRTNGPTNGLMDQQTHPNRDWTEWGFDLERIGDVEMGE